MPYFPPTGGGVVLPNSLDDTLLADMPDGTVKGRALGAGVGDPTNLTVAQLWALLGNPVFTACRLDYVNATTLRLNRWNGTLLTIDNVPQAIPAAGVDYVASGLTAGTDYYVYARMNAGAIALELSTTGYAVDVRNGLKVKTGDATRSLVGWVRWTGTPQFSFGQGARLVRSYYNRKLYAEYISPVSGSTASGTSVQIAFIAEFSYWADEKAAFAVTGYNYNASQNNYCVSQIAITDQSGAVVVTSNAGQIAQCANGTTNQYMPVSIEGGLSGMQYPTIAEKYLAARLYGSVNTGTGNWACSGTSIGTC